MFDTLEKINTRPAPFEFYTASELWTDEHTSARMLAFHLNPDIDVSSRGTDFIDRSVEWLAGRFRIGPATRIADFGCGPGLYTTRLARRGAEVTGIDFSPRSIGHARDTADREGLPIRYVCRNYLEFDTPQRYDLILMIMCDFCALSPVQRRQLLGRFHRLLAPGGAVVLDVYALPAFDRRRETAVYEADLLDGFWSPERYYGFLNVFKYDRQKVTLDKYSIVEAARIRTVYNWLQHFSPEALDAEMAEAGFTVAARLADVAGTPFDPQGEEFAVVAEID